MAYSSVSTCGFLAGGGRETSADNDCESKVGAKLEQTSPQQSFNMPNSNLLN